MNVLVACEESQRVCKAFRLKGFNAFSCDILSCSGNRPEWHICGDCIPLLNGDCEFTTSDGKTHTIEGKWDLIIAFPPCTYMSSAGACRMFPTKGKIDENRLKKGLEAKEFFLKLWSANCDRIAIENPRPLKCIGLPKQTQSIQPYQFGEPWCKLTYLWLKGLPPLISTELVQDYRPYVSCGTSRNKGNKIKSGMSRAGGAQKVRSKTFKGVAKAMADQWCNYLLKGCD